MYSLLCERCRNVSIERERQHIRMGLARKYPLGWERFPHQNSLPYCPPYWLSAILPLSGLRSARRSHPHPSGSFLYRNRYTTFELTHSTQRQHSNVHMPPPPPPAVCLTHVAHIVQRTLLQGTPTLLTSPVPRKYWYKNTMINNNVNWQGSPLHASKSFAQTVETTHQSKWVTDFDKSTDSTMRIT